LPDGTSGVIGGPIESVVIVGGEIVGWSVAAALKRRLPYLAVTVVPAASAKEDLANQLISTLPSITGFHEDIGLTEADTVARAASSLRLGSRFRGWVEGSPPYVHAYGSYGQQMDGAPFHQLWLRQKERAATDGFHAFSLQAEMGEHDRIADPRSPAGSELQYGLQIDRDLYLSMISAYGDHLGAKTMSASFTSARIRPTDGFIDAVLLDDGRELSADLYIDCSGPAAVLRSQLTDELEDWGQWLLSDRLVIAAPHPSDRLPAIDEIEAVDIGWKWRAYSPRRASSGIVYSSQFGDAEAAVAHLSSPGAATGESIAFRQGRRRDPWIRNCVAVGAAAVTVEPLEWTNLHLVHSAVDRIIAMMPGRDCAPIELSEYNRQCSDEADRIRDFLCLHYVTSKREEPFWAAARAIMPPPSLAHTLSLFQERGRLPFYEEETFARDSWLAVLFGQGVFPTRIDPLADVVAPETAETAISRLRTMIAKTVPTLPSHEAYLRHFQRTVQ
jgi:tryptophan halogenase